MAENSDKPEEWLLYPTGYVFQFDAQISIDFLKTALNEKDAEILKIQKKIEKLEREKAEIVAEIADLRSWFLRLRLRIQTKRIVWNW